MVFFLMTVSNVRAKYAKKIRWTGNNTPSTSRDEFQYVHDYDPTPRRLPPNLLKQLLDIVELKYGHLKNKKLKSSKLKFL